MSQPRIAFIGAGSTVFMKNIVGDILQRPALSGATIALMDIDPKRLEESEAVARKLAATLGAPARIETCGDQRRALEGADFVVVAFQIGGYDPCTIVDFEIPRRYGLRQTIADTLGVGGVMRGLRTVPHLWKVCEDMLKVCPRAILLQYVNPMAINTWAISARFPDHPSGRPLPFRAGHGGGTRARSRNAAVDEIRYRAAGINHMAFYLEFEGRERDGTWRDLYPELIAGYRAGRLPRPARSALPQQGALRDADAARLFRHRELGAFRRIHALFHQARARGPDREIRHSARRISQALHRADRALERDRRDFIARPTASR